MELETVMVVLTVILMVVLMVILLEKQLVLDPEIHLEKQSSGTP